MSRIGSSSGVRVAAAPLSNVYTVLLLIAALVLALVLTAVWLKTDGRYGVVLGVSDEGKANMQLPDTIKGQQAAETQKLKEKLAEIKKFQMDPGAEPKPEAAAPAAPAPEAATPAAPAAPATPPAAAPAAATTPAPAAPGAEPPKDAAPAATPAPAGEPK